MIFELYCDSIEESLALSLEEKEQRALNRIQALKERFKPSHIVACCSGGHDSRVVTHLVSRAAPEFKVFHIDTGIKVIDEPYNPETGVVNLCNQYDWELLIYRAIENCMADGTPDPQVYADLVLNGCHGKGFPDAGFPGPSLHVLYFSRLKERQIHRLARDLATLDPEKGFTDYKKILLLTGVRMFESDRRWTNVQRWGAFVEEGIRIWGNPIAEWTGGDVAAYMQQHDIPLSLLKKGLCMSGECLCNCFKLDPVQMEFLRTECPKTWNMIKALEQKAFDMGYVWGFNEIRPDWWTRQDELFADTEIDLDWSPPLCTSCVSRHQDNQSLLAEDEPLSTKLVLPDALPSAPPAASLFPFQVGTMPSMDQLINHLAIGVMPGNQGGRQFYATMMTLETLASLAVFDESVVPDDMKAQRPFTESRVPKIAHYVGGEKWVFDSITLAIAGDGEYYPLATGISSMGLLLISRNEVWRVIDGQHRLGGIRAALARNPALASQTVMVGIYVGCDVQAVRWMFNDLNYWRIKPSTSLAIAFEGRDDRALLTQAVHRQVEFFYNLTETRRNSLPARSSRLFCLSHIYQATMALLKGMSFDNQEAKVSFAVGYWQAISEDISIWQQVNQGHLSAMEARNEFVVSLAVVLVALGQLGNRLHQENPKQYLKKLSGLSKVNWRRSNPAWSGILFGVSGKVEKSISVSNAIADYLYSHLK